MSAWTTDRRQGYRTKTIRHGNCTIIIHRPELSPAEQNKRESTVRNALKHMNLNGGADDSRTTAC